MDLFSKGLPETVFEFCLALFLPNSVLAMKIASVADMSLKTILLLLLLQTCFLSMHFKFCT